jgi:hypothetical protein
MKYRSFLFSALFVFFIGFSKAQTNTAWTPVLISMDGTNSYNGVELNYQLTKCGNDDVLLLKLTNTNTYSVKAHWINVIKTKDGKELYGNSKLTSVTLGANAENNGNCKGKPAELKIKLSDFGANASNFETIVGSSFDTSKN